MFRRFAPAVARCSVRLEFVRHCATIQEPTIQELQRTIDGMQSTMKVQQDLITNMKEEKQSMKEMSEKLYENQKQQNDELIKRYTNEITDLQQRYVNEITDLQHQLGVISLREAVAQLLRQTYTEVKKIINQGGHADKMSTVFWDWQNLTTETLVEDFLTVFANNTLRKQFTLSPASSAVVEAYSAAKGVKLYKLLSNYHHELNYKALDAVDISKMRNIDPTQQQLLEKLVEIIRRLLPTRYSTPGRHRRLRRLR